jgi:hypothetical protein
MIDSSPADGVSPLSGPGSWTGPGSGCPPRSWPRPRRPERSSGSWTQGDAVAPQTRSRRRSARPCWPGWPPQRSCCWRPCGRPVRTRAASPAGVTRRRRTPPVASPDTRSRRSRCTPTTPSSPWASRLTACRGGARRCRGEPVHHPLHDERLAAQAHRFRLPRHRGPLLAPSADSR